MCVCGGGGGGKSVCERGCVCGGGWSAKGCMCVCAYMCKVDHHMVITDVSGVVTIDK